MSAEPIERHSLRQGAKLVEQGELARALQERRVGWLPDIQVGPFRLDGEDASKHIALIGAPGSGKTVLIRLLMQSVLPTIGKSWKGRLSEAQVKAELIAGVAEVIGAAVDAQGRGLRVEPPVATPKSQVPPTPQYQTRTLEEPLSPKDQKYRERWLFAGRLLLLSFGIFALFAIFASGGVVAPLPIFGTALWFFLGSLAYWLLVTVGAFLLGRRLIPKKRLVREEIPIRSAPPAAPLKIFRPPSYDGPMKWDGHRAVIFDAKLEVIPELFGMDIACPIHIFNPFDERCTAWDMAKDITEPAIAKQIAAIFIPDEKKASQPYFADASRQLLEGVLVSFILTQGDRWTFRDVLNATKTRDALAGVLSAAPNTAHLVETYLSHERETKSTLATLATKLGNFDVVAALWDNARTKFSIKDWLDSESILVLGNDEAYRSSLGVINRVVFNRIVEMLLARKATSLGRTWFFLDEVKEAGELDALDRLMTKGRSFGAAVVLGFQNISGLYETFGENPAKSILGQCATKVFLRVDSPETAEWAQSVFGEYEAIELKQSATMGESSSEGTTKTTSTSSSTTETSGQSRSGMGVGTTIGTNSSSSQTTSTSESSGTSTTKGENRSLSKSADIVKRHLVLAAEFMHLPMTSSSTGLHGYISHHLGKARFVYRGFERDLMAPPDTVERVVYRPPSQQFLRPWSSEEAARFVPSRVGEPESPASEAAGTFQNVSQSEPVKNLSQVLAGHKGRQGRGRSLLPSSNPENGLVRES